MLPPLLERRACRGFGRSLPPGRDPRPRQRMSPSGRRGAAQRRCSPRRPHLPPPLHPKPFGLGWTSTGKCVYAPLLSYSVPALPRAPPAEEDIKREVGKRLSAFKASPPCWPGFLAADTAALLPPLPPKGLTSLCVHLPGCLPPKQASNRVFAPPALLCRPALACPAGLFPAGADPRVCDRRAAQGPHRQDLAPPHGGRLHHR